MDHELATCICIICIYIIITEPIIYRAKIAPHAKFIETGGRCLKVFDPVHFETDAKTLHHGALPDP